MGQQEDVQFGWQDALIWFFRVALVFCFVGLIVLFVRSIRIDAASRDPEYAVAVTGVAGLDLAAGDAPALSPVFNLTVRIDNAGNLLSTACVYSHATAVVSYGDAFLGKGSVPAFCAGERQVEERAATAWGQDVVVPRFLRDRLAGELERGGAEVDVEVTISRAGCASCHDKVLVCKAKIGGGPSPCELDYIYPRPGQGAGDTIV